MNIRTLTLIVLFCYASSFRVVVKSNSFQSFHLKSTQDSDSYEDKSSIWRDKVEYIDISTVDTSESPTSRHLPLFLLGGAFYPKGTTALHVFEMKYRTMMFDIAKADKLFGYIHSDYSTGQIAKVGTLCKIVQTELLEDGRQYVALEGVGRFAVRRIVKTLPYVVADVETNILDSVPADLIAIEKLEYSVYDALKYYMRLMKCYGPNKDMVISQAAKISRPTPKSILDNNRRSDFSFALANMIQMTQDKESQLLLQTTDITKRLDAEKIILSQAADLVGEKLIEMNVISADQRDRIKIETYTRDFEEDILPADFNEVETTQEADEWDISNVM